MPDLARFANRFRLLVLLRALLLAGATLEVLTAALLLLSPATLAALVGWPAPDRGVGLQLLAVSLLLLAALAWEAARDPRRYSAIVRAAIAGHLLAAAVLAVAAFRDPVAAARLGWIAGGSALLGLALAATWWTVRA